MVKKKSIKERLTKFYSVDPGLFAVMILMGVLILALSVFITYVVATTKDELYKANNTISSLESTNYDLRNQVANDEAEIQRLEADITDLEQELGDDRGTSSSSRPSIQSVCGSDAPLPLSVTDPDNFNKRHNAWMTCIENYGKGIF